MDTHNLQDWDPGKVPTNDGRKRPMFTCVHGCKFLVTFQIIWSNQYYCKALPLRDSYRPLVDPHWCIHGSHSPPARPLVSFQSYTKGRSCETFFEKKLTCWVHTSMIQHSRQTECHLAIGPWGTCWNSGDFYRWARHRSCGFGWGTWRGESNSTWGPRVKIVGVHHWCFFFCDWWYFSETLRLSGQNEWNVE